MFTQEEFERWLAGLPAGLHDPTLRNATLVAPTILGGTLVAPTILGATLDSPTITGIPTAPSAVPGTISNQLATTTGTIAVTAFVHMCAQLRRTYVQP